MRRRAFTLIELLVVIAIIAILAAILFPVFTQAKTSAKQAGATSDLKQTTLAILMYAGDNDDVFMPKLRVGYAAPNGPDPTVAMTWDKLIQPYSKNYAILVSGMDPRSKFTSPYGMVRRGYAVASNAFKGVQVNFASLGWGTPFPLQSSASASSFASPTGTVILGERRQLQRAIPDLWTHIDWHKEAWLEHSRVLDGYGNPNDPRRQYAQIDNKYNLGSVWAFADGHVKAFRPSGVANDGTKQGVKFEGYEQKAGTWVNSTDPYWDQGLSCFDAEWNANNNSRDCKLPDQS